MNRLCLEINGVCLIIEGEGLERLRSSYDTTFARRYIPDYVIRQDGCMGWIGAEIKWNWVEEGFKLVLAKYGSGDEKDYYIVLSSLPGAYVNEAPYFFILQVFSRALARRGMIVFTDAVSFMLPNGKAVLLLGYPHTGKSTLTAIAASKGYMPLSTENTLIKIDKGVRIVGGTSVLVYDPVIKDLYNVILPAHEKTRHGYIVVDLNKLYPERLSLIGKGIEVQSIYVLHCSFHSVGADDKLIKGRKIKKTLWYFTTSLIKGMDYYDPSPLDLPFGGEVAENITRLLAEFSKNCSGRIYEIFGRHDEVFKRIVEKENV